MQFAHPLAFRLGWLAPATMAVLLMGVLFNQRSIQYALAGTSGSGPMVAVAMSNQSAAAWLPGSFASQQNNIPANAFDWTNKDVASSSVAPLPPAKVE